MPSKSKQEIAAQYENYSIYVLLSSRGALPDFHWGIFIPTETPDGKVWHATDREGGWKLDPRASSNVPFSMSLVLAHKIGSIHPSALQRCNAIFEGLPADGRPSPYTGEQFDCRVWVKDAILALQENGIIELHETISSMEKRLIELAYAYKSEVEEGQRDAEVVNSDA